MRWSARKCVVAALMALLLLALGAVLTAGCGGGEKASTTPEAAHQDTAPATETSAPGTKVFNAQELAGFDGKNGRPAYVAVDGVVYDVTGSDDWPEGDHTPCNLDAAAGKDLSQVITQAPPSMRTFIQARPVVGTYQSD
jgi:predicted heme/steroid binding protein